MLNRLSNLTDTALVPALWLYEVVNVTGLAIRKGRIPEQKAQDFLESLADLPIAIENPTQAQMFVSVRLLVSQHKLTAYDASYLELTMRHKVPLATLDKALAKAAEATGVSLIEL